MSRQEYRFAASPCPHCGRLLDRGREVDSDPPGGPEPGCVSVCAYCCRLSLFGDDLRLRVLTAAELSALRSSPQWVDIQQAVSALIRAKGWRE